MRRFTFAPSLAIRGRRFKGLRGYAGKPFHPPLTDVPIAAYLFAAVFDVVSAVLPAGHEATARQLYVAGTWLLLGGVGVSLLAALTGWADWHRSSEPGTQARRTINAHAVTMLTVTGAALIDLVLRAAAYGDDVATPAGLVVLTVAVAAVVSLGATIGGSLVYDYGFNVETAGDHPVWHRSEADVFHGRSAPTSTTATSTTAGTAADPVDVP